jgi:hypothetical protein
MSNKHWSMRRTSRYLIVLALLAAAIAASSQATESARRHTLSLSMIKTSLNDQNLLHLRLHDTVHETVGREEADAR